MDLISFFFLGGGGTFFSVGKCWLFLFWEFGGILAMFNFWNVCYIGKCCKGMLAVSGILGFMRFDNFWTYKNSCTLRDFAIIMCWDILLRWSMFQFSKSGKFCYVRCLGCLLNLGNFATFRNCGCFGDLRPGILWKLAMFCN